MTNGSGISWVDGRPLTAAQMTKLDQSKANADGGVLTDVTIAGGSVSADVSNSTIGDTPISQLNENVNQALSRVIPATPSTAGLTKPGSGFQVSEDGTITFDLASAAGAAAFGSSAFPFTVGAVNGEPLLTVDRDKGGRVYISLDVNDAQGHLVVRIVRNEIIVPQMNGYLVPRSDLHSIVVWDKFGNEALNIHYLNKNAIQFSGYINSEIDLRSAVKPPGAGICRKPPDGRMKN